VEELKKQLIELLKDQQLIFGDDLFENINLDIYEKPKKELAIKFVQDETIEKNKELNLIFI